MIDHRGGDVARGIAREHRDRRVDVLVVREREEGDVNRRIALDADGGAREPGIDAIADAHARLDVRGGRSIDDEFRAAKVHVVERRHDRCLRRLEAHLHIACRLDGDLPHPAQHRARRVDDDARRSRLELGNRALADRPRDEQAIRGLLSRRRVGRLVQREDRIGLAVLFERDVEARQLTLRRLHHHLERAVLSDEFLGLAEFNARGRLTPRPPPRCAADDDPQDNQKQKDLRERTHPTMIAPVVTFLG